jgi:hypothetical protein
MYIFYFINILHTYIFGVLDFVGALFERTGCTVYLPRSTFFPRSQNKRTVYLPRSQKKMYGIQSRWLANSDALSQVSSLNSQPW